MTLSRVALLLAVCLATVAARPVDEQTSMSFDSSLALTAEGALANPHATFDLWMTQHGKDYKDDVAEKAKRRSIFLENAALVAENNARNSGVTLALNAFADLTFEEFARTHLGYQAARSANRTGTPFSYGAVADVPAEVDWRDKGAVTGVKNQGMCGSCWAFSAVGAIEGVNYLKTGKLVSLSEQQLVGCDPQSNGCGGGLMDYAFEYVLKNGGLDTELDYPYWSWDLPCQHRREEHRHVVTIDGYEDVPENDAAALKKAIAGQPVSVAICANAKLQLYSSGVFTEEECCDQLNHGVLAVGYTDDYLTIKNSWGATWGEQGYFRLSSAAKSKEGTCGVNKVASYPVKKSDKNPPVYDICGYFGWTECPPASSCVCEFDLFGLFCFQWGCQATPEPQQQA